MKLDNPILDSSASEARDAWLAEALRQQIAFMRAAVPFWRERLLHAAIDERDIVTLADLGADLTRVMPPASCMHRARLRSRSAVGQAAPQGCHVNFWSEKDWAALVASTARMVGRQTPTRAPTVFNAYSQAHVTGPLYNAALCQLGGIVYDRSHHPEEFFSTLDQADMFDFDTVVLPARSTRGKGIGLADLLDEDPKFLARHRALVD